MKIHQTEAAQMLTSEPLIHPSASIIHSRAGSFTSIGAANKIIESDIGDYSYTMDDVTMNYTEAGKYVSIASHVCINPVDHPMDRVTQHHMTYRCKSYGLAEEDDDSIFDWRRGRRVKIGHDVWIGHGAIIMKGVEIGIGAVVGAGAIVTKPVEPYTIVAGVPARPIRKRFSEDIIEKLLASAWWDWPRDVLEERFKDLNDVEGFLKKYG
ncbi:acetyltransferase [Bacillus mangrovi]|uniref:Acetyltransferase n=1 Tax=Metabacillus mangrovi TaxID=1491830 RepID=A0A7X2S5A9_9BACI|nr:DapH/DapD/GlmU-related protein [Metabacillus mangrovi]MTH53515.1 acetyltransferase [Metabacillus mangrovi]